VANGVAIADAVDALYPPLFESLPDAMIVVNRQGVITLANEKACVMFGWSRSELVGAMVERLIPPRFVEGHPQRRQHFHDHSQPMSIGVDRELIGLRRQGVEFPLEIALSHVRIGQEIQVAASIRDLTHTLRFKDAAKRAHYSSQLVKVGALALRSKGLDEMLASVPDFIVGTLSTDIVIVFWSLHGDELRPRIIHGVSGAHASRLEAAATVRIEGKNPLVGEQPRIIRDYRNETGADALLARELGLSSSLRVPLTAETRLVGLLVTYSRQTDQFGEQELYFMQAVGNVIVAAFMRAEIESQLAFSQRLDSIGQLTGGIAHDFNNILTIVLGNLQMLREAMEQSGAGDYLKLVESAQRASKRGAELTHKLLTFASRQSLAPHAIDPAAALVALTEMLQRTIGETIKIHLQVAPACPPCLADPLQFDNAIINLTLNARDSMPDGGQLRITATPSVVREDTPDIGGELAPGMYVMISVSDTGHGMSPETMLRVYEPFFTTKPSGKGTGLGLSMVYGFVKQSRGTIRMQSIPGRGTDVQVYFPTAERRSSVSASHAGTHDRGRRLQPGQKTILVVDDDLEVLDLAEVLLVRSGYRVMRASDTAGALQYLAGPEPISLLFTDVVLGAGETGPKLAAEALKIRPGLPVLYTSGFAHGALDDADREPDQFLAKPYELVELIARIESLLANGNRRDVN
jgi:PAS domain S-box-containing protein